jgi:hemoglobin
MMPIADIQQIYADIGDAGFRALVEAFYRRVEADESLRAIFPPDLTNGRERQYLFLRQFFGGPPEYNERHGPPMLRRRHFPFAITREAQEAWLRHMLAAIDEVAIPEPHASTMRQYFERFSVEMINRGDDAATSDRISTVDVGGRAPSSGPGGLIPVQEP